MKEIKIKDVSIDIQTGPFGSQLHASDYSVDGVPVIMPQDILNFRVSEKQIARVDESHILRLKRHKVNKGDIIFPRRGNFSKCALITNYERGWLCGTGCLKIKLNPHKVFPEYVYFALQQPKVIKLIEDNTVGSTMPNLNTKILGDINIPFIPESIPEQKSIAEVLHDVDELIATTEALLQKKRDIKQGTMQQLLSGKLRLPGFSEPWVKEKISTITSITMGQSPESLAYNELRLGLPLIQGKADWVNRKQIVRVYTSKVTKTCEGNVVIMSVRAPVGAVAKSVTQSCLGRGVCSLNEANNFLYHYLIFIENTWSELSGGSIFDSISGTELGNRTLFIPSSLAEQDTIAKVLSDMDAEIEALERNLDKYKAIREAMMQQLLTGKIRLI